MLSMAFISGKAVGLILLAVAGYVVASYLGILPPSIENLIGWANTNTDALLVAVCFLAFCYVLVLRQRKKNQG
jgi:hypothetical protein